MEKPKPIRSILEKTLKTLEIDVPLKTYSIWGAWRGIVGESVALQTQPRSIRNRILFVDVSHSTWIQQLQFLKPTLLGKINEFLGEPLIQDIRFRLGKISPSLPAPPKIPQWDEEKLDKRAMNRIENLVREIDDEEVRKGFRNVLIKAAKLERFRGKLR
jgi:predicted nucleic acid-binding Zn ribbon protein